MSCETCEAASWGGLIVFGQVCDSDRKRVSGGRHTIDGQSISALSIGRDQDALVLSPAVRRWLPVVGVSRHHAILDLADGSPGRARADVNRWLFWSAYHFTPAVGFISRERVSKKMVGGSGAPDRAEIERGEALLAAAAQALDDHLARNKWIAQDKLTLADPAIASPLMHTAAAELPVTGYENVQACLHGCKRSMPGRSQRLCCWRPRSDGDHR